MQDHDQDSIGTWLARLGGAHAEVIQLAPKVKRDFIALALVLLATASIAAVSMAFAMADGLKAHPVVAVIVGLFWGAVILAIDRALVISLKPKGGKWRMFWMIAPRVVMAALLGFVISMPLTLRVFADEIRQQMTMDHIESANQAARNLADGELKQRLTEVEEKISWYEGVLAGTNFDYTSPALAQAQEEYDAAKAAYDAKQSEAEQAYRKWQCELYGVGCEGTSGIPGNGNLARASEQEYRNRLAEAEQLKAIMDTKLAALLAAENANATEAEQAFAEAKADAETQLANLRPERDRLRTQLAELNDRAQAERQEGLLAQLVALEHLGAENGAARMAHILLAGLFFMIELLPVAIKTLSSMGPTTLYERADKYHDDRAMDLVTARSNRQHVKQQLIDQKAIESEVRVVELVQNRVEQVVSQLALQVVDQWAETARTSVADYAQQVQPCPRCGRPTDAGHVCSIGNGARPWDVPTAPQDRGPYNIPNPRQDNSPRSNPPQGNPRHPPNGGGGGTPL